MVDVLEVVEVAAHDVPRAEEDEVFGQHSRYGVHRRHNGCLDALCIINTVHYLLLVVSNLVALLHCDVFLYLEFVTLRENFCLLTFQCGVLCLDGVTLREDFLSLEFKLGVFELDGFFLLHNFRGALFHYLLQHLVATFELFLTPFYDSDYQRCKCYYKEQYHPPAQIEGLHYFKFERIGGAPDAVLALGAIYKFVFAGGKVLVAGVVFLASRRGVVVVETFHIKFVCNRFFVLEGETRKLKDEVVFVRLELVALQRNLFTVEEEVFDAALWHKFDGVFLAEVVCRYAVVSGHVEHTFTIKQKTVGDNLVAGKSVIGVHHDIDIVVGDVVIAEAPVSAEPKVVFVVVFVAHLLYRVDGDVGQCRYGQHLEIAVHCEFAKTFLHAHPKHIVDGGETKHRRGRGAEILKGDAIVPDKSRIVAAHQHIFVADNLAYKRCEIVGDGRRLFVETCNPIYQPVCARHQEYVA